ncbi:hypothetical protein N9018_00685 [Rhodopirellula sp.]|nr:hypothetical protein [Rhodopirellula sp.]
MSNQQTFDFLAGYCPQGETRVKDVARVDDLSAGQCDQGSQPVPEPVKEFRAGTDWQCLEQRNLSPASVAESGHPLDGQGVDALAAEKQDRESVLRKLRVELGCVLPGSENETQAIYSTGSESIDGMLPRGGLRREAITEWVAASESSGAAALSLIAAANLLKFSVKSGPLVVVCGESGFYPPAAVSLGLSVDRIIWVRPKRHADLVWAIDQALRCESVAAVWAHAGPHLDDRDARRFQLASEAGQTAGLLVRPAVTRGRPSFAEVRFHVKHLATTSQQNEAGSGVNSQGNICDETAVQSHRALQITVDRCRGGTSGQQTAVRIDDQGNLRAMPWHHDSLLSPGCSKDNRHETAAVHLASELAHPKTTKRVVASRRA